MVSARPCPPLLQLRHRAQDAAYPIKGIFPSNICRHEYVSTFFAPSKRFSVFSLFFLLFILDISLIFFSYSTFPFILGLPFSSWTSLFSFRFLFLKSWSLIVFEYCSILFFNIFVIFPSLKSLFLIFFFYNWLTFNQHSFISLLRFLIF